MTEDTKIIPQAKRREQAEIEAERRVKAARQAAKVAKEAAEPVLVSCKVLPLGDGKISTGDHVAGIGEVHYEEGETFQAIEATAKAYKAKGWVLTQ